MSEGNGQENMSRSQNVGRTASQTPRRGSDAIWLPTHGDTDVACSLYVYTVTAVVVRQSKC